MAIRQIFVEGDAVLTEKSKEVKVFDEKLHELIEDLKDTMEVTDGVGIAAPQVGILKRVILAKLDDKIIELINPILIKMSGEQREQEGCLSCPGKVGITVRPKKVEVKAFDRYGKEFNIVEENLNARILCHEIDHLDGILFNSRLLTKEIFLPKKFGF